MLVSFIIPAYNAAGTIVRCLESIYRLSLHPEEFEVIVIDDASTDNTCEIVQAYSQPLPIGNGVSNLTLLHQPENHRQGAARNRGVKIAKGEYICFVDADDAVTEGIMSAIRLARDKHLDMVAFHYGNANERGEITSEAQRLSFAENQIFSGIEMQNTHPYWCSGPVPYVYRRAFLERVDYPFVEDVLFEDSDFVAVHLYYARRMMYSSSIGYLIYSREGSTTRSINHKNLADYLLLGTRMLAFYDRITHERENELMSEGEREFAEGILEGACWNVEKSCKRLIRLTNIREVRAYYDRIDRNVDRSTLCRDERLHRYYWDAWTTICLKYKQIAIILLVLLMPIYRLMKELRTKRKR